MAATLVDTNVTLRLLQPQHPHYPIAVTALTKLRGQGADLCVAVQNLVEFWVVATRPLVNNGLGLSPLTVAGEVRALQGIFRLLEGKTGVAATWERLAGQHLVSGKQAHDTHLVATMQVHSVTDILTFNVPDFSRFPGITVLDPAQF
jgi:predicted nucleic acid-binding protein